MLPPCDPPRAGIGNDMGSYSAVIEPNANILVQGALGENSLERSNTETYGEFWPRLISIKLRSTGGERHR